MGQLYVPNKSVKLYVPRLLHLRTFSFLLEKIILLVGKKNTLYSACTMGIFALLGVDGRGGIKATQSREVFVIGRMLPV